MGSKLFQYFYDLPYFAKDRFGRFTAANVAFLEMAGLEKESDLLGKKDYDIWPRFLAEQYAKDDARVMESGIPVVNRIELVLGQDLTTDWFSTTKVPIHVGGKVAGIEGVCRYLKKAKSPKESVSRMPAVIEFIMENYSRKIDILVLAKIMCLSVRQFERKFKQEFGLVPVQYILRIRLEAAQQLLAMTQLPISQITSEIGFYDSSHFARKFQKATGFSPTAFRKLHLQSGGRGN